MMDADAKRDFAFLGLGIAIGAMFATLFGVLF